MTPRTYAERLFVAMLSAAVGLGLAGVLINATAAPVEGPALEAGPLDFDGARALATTREFVTDFPSRCAGDPLKSQAAQWIVDHFVELGYDPQVQSFGAWIGGAYYPDLATVWAVRRGRGPGTIVVFGHYDIPAFVTQGAADDGSAVGAVFELARSYAARVPERSICFVLFDGSEYGLAGSSGFTSRLPFSDPVVAAVGLDFLNPGPLAGISVECTGTQKGYTPLWLRSLAGAAATAEAGRAVQPDPVTEWLERSVAVAPTDAGMFLHNGIPAVNLAGLPADPALEWSTYHTPGDVVENLDADAFAQWGRTAERLIRSIEALPRLPGGRAAAMVYTGLGGGRSLPGGVVRLGQLLVFAPLFGVVGAGWYWRRRALVPTLLILLGEARRVFALAGCLFLGFLALKVLPVVGLLPRYHVYPATPRDPLLYYPSVLAVLIPLAVAGVAICAVSRYTRWLAPPLAADWNERNHAFTTLLALVVFTTWLEGAGYAAVTFLALPAYLWLFLAEPAGRGAAAKRVLGALLVLGGTAAFVGLAVAIGPTMMAGPGWWYLFLGAAYGLFGFKAAVMTLVTAGLFWEAFACGTGVGLGRVLPSDFQEVSADGRGIALPL